MRVYVVMPDSDDPPAENIRDLLPIGVVATFVADSDAGTTMKQDILASATHLILVYPRTGGLSLMFALLRTSFHPEQPRLLVVTDADLSPLFAMAEPEEQTALNTRRAAGAFALTTDLSARAIGAFLFRDTA